MQHFYRASWIAVHSSNDQYSAHAIASIALADSEGPELPQHAQLFTGIFLVAFIALVSRIVVNWNAPKYVPSQADILVALKAFFGAVYVAGAITILVSSDRSQWILLSTEAATAVSRVFSCTTMTLMLLL